MDTKKVALIGGGVAGGLGLAFVARRAYLINDAARANFAEACRGSRNYKQIEPSFVDGIAAAIVGARYAVDPNPAYSAYVPSKSPGSCSTAMGEVDAVRRKVAEIAMKELWKTMGRPGDVPWWLVDIRVAQDRDNNYFLKGIISAKLPMDDTGWPYGLPHTQDGVKVVAEVENTGELPPVKLGPTN